MATRSPFSILQNIEQRCRSNSLGLPAGEQVEEDWVGIGFELCGEPLIARMSEINEILPPPETIRIPGVLPWVRGLANVRGSLIPVVDVQALLCGEYIRPGKKNRLLVIDQDDIQAGVLVNEVYGLRRFKPEDKQPRAPAAKAALKDLLDGGFGDERQQWSVFSVKRLVGNEQFLRVT
jgi:twitching motility protein PilI